MRSVLVAMMLATMACLVGAAASARGTIVRGRCHLDQCAWVDLRARTTVRSVPAGELVRIALATGVSEHPDGSYDRQTPVRWRPATREYVFCSKVLPSVVFRFEKRWIAHILAPGHAAGVFGYNTTSYAIYFLVCHGLAPADPSDPALARKFGYADSLVKGVDQITLAAPEDIVKLAAANAH